MAYSGDEIRVLTLAEAVRKRPGMYFGGTDQAAMHHLLWEVIGNAIDEHRRGHGTTVRVTFDFDAVTIEDDGRGIPVEPSQNDPTVSQLEHVMTTMHRGSGFSREHVHLTSSLSGVGVAVVNAACERFDVEVWHAGRHHAQSYARGIPLGPPRDLGASSRTGTRVRFVPDATIFDGTWDRAGVAARLRELAAMAPGLALVCDGEVYCCHDGLADRVRYLARDRTLPQRPIELRAIDKGVAVTAALAWTDDDRAVTEAYVGMAHARGTHLIGFVRGMFGAFARVEPGLAKVDRLAFREVIERGLVAVVHVQLHDPRFGSPSRSWLTNPEVATVVAAAVRSQLAAALLAERGVLTTLFTRGPRITRIYDREL
jgi:DNA gyrase subunit B